MASFRPSILCSKTLFSIISPAANLILLHQTLGGFSQHVPLILAQVVFLILGLEQVSVL
jgi:hypothetical protein